jgi:hypothetical protein
MHPAPTDRDAPDDLQREHLISIPRVSQRYGQTICCELASTF